MQSILQNFDAFEFHIVVRFRLTKRFTEIETNSHFRTTSSAIQDKRISHKFVNNNFIDKSTQNHGRWSNFKLNQNTKPFTQLCI